MTEDERRQEIEKQIYIDTAKKFLANIVIYLLIVGEVVLTLDERLQPLEIYSYIIAIILLIGLDRHTKHLADTIEDLKIKLEDPNDSLEKRRALQLLKEREEQWFQGDTKVAEELAKVIEILEDHK